MEKVKNEALFKYVFESVTKTEMHNNGKFIFNTVNLIQKEPRATSEFNFIVMQLTDNNVIRKSAMQE